MPKWLQVVKICFIINAQGEVMFIGNFIHQIDQKGRIRVPAKFRAEIGNGYTILKGDNGCLKFYSEKETEALYERLNQVPVTDIEGMKAVRMIMSSAYIPEEDSQGRFVLPQELRNFIKANKQIIFIGLGNRFELWSYDKWVEYSGDDTDKSFDDNIKSLAKYGF